MRTGNLFDIITIYTLVETTVSGNDVETWGTGVECRAEVNQISGSRYYSVDQLVDREVYSIKLWDNSWDSKIKIVYNGKTLYPIMPPRRVKDNSQRGVVEIITATKV
jgi:hypothetical protein